MRRRLLTGTASLVLARGLVLPVAAQDDHDHGVCTDAGLAGSSEFGPHVHAMAVEGHLGAEHHPGLHDGYAVCLTDDSD
jgi:hypothetical protein